MKNVIYVEWSAFYVYSTYYSILYSILYRQVGHGRSRFLGKDDSFESTLAIYCTLNFYR